MTPRPDAGPSSSTSPCGGTSCSCRTRYVIGRRFDWNLVRRWNIPGGYLGSRDWLGSWTKRKKRQPDCVPLRNRLVGWVLLVCCPDIIFPQMCVPTLVVWVATSIQLFLFSSIVPRSFSILPSTLRGNCNEPCLFLLGNGGQPRGGVLQRAGRPDGRQRPRTGSGAGGPQRTTRPWLGRRGKRCARAWPIIVCCKMLPLENQAMVVFRRLTAFGISSRRTGLTLCDLLNPRVFCRPQRHDAPFSRKRFELRTCRCVSRRLAQTTAVSGLNNGSYEAPSISWICLCCFAILAKCHVFFRPHAFGRFLPTTAAACSLRCTVMCFPV